MPKSSRRARKVIEKELMGGGQILVPAISAWEIAMLIVRGRLALTMDIDDWLATVESIEGVACVPVDRDVAVQSVRPPGEFHPDATDRMIVVFARHYAVPLVTAGVKIRAYRHVKTVW